MRSQYSTLQRCLLWLAAFILVAGLSGAVFAYRSAVKEEERISALEAAGGNAYGGPDEQSKGYVLEVQRYGGNAAVIAVKFDHWLASLWHGKNLAYTLAILAGGLAFGCFRAANELSDE
ncbi:MAG: hypothetical protein JWP38_1150 [Herbaspirillum sp.]|nr:hypothetical protein [Herbaspirillum sp.]